MLTGVPTSPCTNPYGDYFLGISLRNKQDYARLHGYELHLMAESVDATSPRWALAEGCTAAPGSAIHLVLK